MWMLKLYQKPLSGPHTVWNDGIWTVHSFLPDLSCKQVIAWPHVTKMGQFWFIQFVHGWHLQQFCYLGWHMHISNRLCSRYSKTFECRSMNAATVRRMPLSSLRCVISHYRRTLEQILNLTQLSQFCEDRIRLSSPPVQCSLYCMVLWVSN